MTTLQLVALLFLAAGGAQLMVLWVKRRGLKQAAAEEYAWRAAHCPGEVENVDEAAFVRLYAREHGARGQIYILTTAILAFASTPLVLWILAAVWKVLWRLNGAPRAFGEGTYVWGFFLFFGMIGCWCVIAGVAASRYHARRPKRFDEELRRARLGV